MKEVVEREVDSICRKQWFPICPRIDIVLAKKILRAMP